MSTTPAQNAGSIVQNEPFIDTRMAFRESVTLSSATVDATNSPTTQLRCGLVLGYDAGLDLWIDAGDATVDSNTKAIVDSLEAPDVDWQSVTITVTVDGVDYPVTAGAADDTLAEFITLINTTEKGLATIVVASDDGSGLLRLTSKKAGVRMTVTSTLSTAWGASGVSNTANFNKFGILADSVPSMLGIDGAVEKKQATVVMGNAIVRDSLLFGMTDEAREGLIGRGIQFEA